MSAEPTIRLSLRTPEHVEIPFEVATVGARAAAFLLDMMVLGGALLVIGFLFVLATGDGASEDGFLSAFVLLALFVGRNFYFTLSEIWLRGQTLGKRWLGLLVIAKDGGPLSTEMVVVRNLTRDVELFLPLAVLLSPELLFGDAPGLGRLASLGWLLAVALLPVFNRHRARAGDLCAGTLVVVAPRATLLPDLVRAHAAHGHHVGKKKSPRDEYRFSDEQLDVYGIKELQVLEDVLRQTPPDDALMEAICEKIKRKIGWSRARWEVAPEPFLRAFYEAQRRRLEHKMRMGKRQERKIR